MVDNFENYGTNTQAPISGISVSGGATMYLDTDSYSGSYAGKMVYDGSGYGEMYRSNLNLNITGFDSLVLYVKTNLSTGTSLLVTLITDDNKVWQHFVWMNVDDTAYARYQIQLMDFVCTDGVTGHYNSSSDHIIKTYDLSVAGVARNIYFDDIQFSVYPQSDSNIIDSYENYGTDTSLTPIPGFSIAGGATALSIDSGSNSGNYCAKVVYNSNLAGWAEFGRPGLSISDINYDTFNLCVKSSISEGFNFQILFSTSDGNTWKKLIWVSGVTDWTLLQVNLTDFLNTSTQAAYDPSTYSTTITYYNLSFTGSSKTVYADDIKLTKQNNIVTTVNTKVDDFETAPLGYTMASAGTTLTQDNTSPHWGTYSGKIAFDSAKSGWAEIYKNNCNFNIQGNSVTISMYLKSSIATGFNFEILFTTADSKQWKYLVWINNTDWNHLQIPLTSFRDNATGTIPYNPNKYSSTITGYDLSLAGASKNVWVDDIYFVADNSINWQKNRFVISSFQPVDENSNSLSYEKIFQDCKDAGISLVQLTGIGRKYLESAMAACDKIGVKCIANDSTSFSGSASTPPLNPVTDATVKRDTVTLKQHPSLTGYYLWDEPTSDRFSTVSSVKSLFNTYDSGNLAFSCYLPSYGQYTWSGSPPAYKTYVDNYISTVNPPVISFDYYPFGDNHQGNPSLLTSDMWRDLGYARQKAISTGKPLWFFFQGIGTFAGGANRVGNMTMPKISVQMYAGLAYGVKELSYYSTLGLMTDRNGAKLSMYNDLKTLDGRVNNLGNFLFDKTPQYIYQTNITDTQRSNFFLDNLASSTLISSAPNNLIISVFNDSITSNTYIMLVNKDYTSTVSGNVALKSSKAIQQYDKSNDSVTTISGSSTTISISIAGGDAVLYILQ